MTWGFRGLTLDTKILFRFYDKCLGLMSIEISLYAICWDSAVQWKVNSSGHLFSKRVNSSGHFHKVNSSGHSGCILVESEKL